VAWAEWTTKSPPFPALGTELHDAAAKKPDWQQSGFFCLSAPVIKLTLGRKLFTQIYSACPNDTVRYFDLVPRQINDQSIVIVEDDQYISEALNDFFSNRNSVKTFASAEEALAAEGQFNNVNVFILDYKLPGKNGIELFQHFRERFHAAKYILITGEMNYEVAEETRRLGLDALMLKPFDFTILEDNISGLISTSHS
jgi:CheY-like chemotaxis protein